MTRDTRDADYDPSGTARVTAAADERNATIAARAEANRQSALYDPWQAPYKANELSALLQEQREEERRQMRIASGAAAAEARAKRGAEEDRLMAETRAAFGPSSIRIGGETLRITAGAEGMDSAKNVKYEPSEDRAAAIEESILSTARGLSRGAVTRDSVVVVPEVDADGIVVSTFETTVAVAQRMGLLEQVSPGVWRDSGKVPLAGSGGSAFVRRA